MNFLKADKEKPCQKIIKAFFGRTKRGSVDPTHVLLVKKVNTKVNISTSTFYWLTGGELQLISLDNSTKD